MTLKQPSGTSQNAAVCGMKINDIRWSGVYTLKAQKFLTNYYFGISIEAAATSSGALRISKTGTQ
jgi:hypothetical protein